jgi:DHA3 family macrolide efflux protein-like MFS transporter
MNEGTNHETLHRKGWKTTFFTIWVGQAFSLVGSSLVGFALIWWMSITTGSATVLALAAMMDMLPRVLIGPLAGALVDRFDRRWVMILADSLTAIATVVLLYLSWQGLLKPWHVYTLMFVRSTGGTFHLPAMQAATSLMVPDDQFARIQGLNQILTGAMNIITPPLGALLIGILPLHGILAIDIGTAVLAVLPLFLIAIPEPKKDGIASVAPQVKRSVWQDMLAGMHYIWNWRGLRIALAIAVALNLVTVPAMSLLPILVTRHFQGGAMELASLNSSWSVGVLVGGVLLSAWGGFRRKVTTIVMGVLVASLSFFLVGIAPSQLFLLALGSLLVAGAMNTITNGTFFALLQSIVDSDMQGRVFSLLISVSGALSPIGLMIAGPVADRIGVGAWFLLAGIVGLLGCSVFWLSPAVRGLENGYDAPPEVAPSIMDSL